MLRILKILDALRWFMFLIINERNSKQGHAKQCSLAILMVLKDANSMIQFQANHRSRDVVFLEGKFHEFGTEHSAERIERLILLLLFMSMTLYGFQTT